MELYVVLCRDYLKAVPGTTTLKGIPLAKLHSTVEAWKKGAAHSTGGALVADGSPVVDDKKGDNLGL